MERKEFQKPFSEKALENFDKIFCPKGGEIGESFGCLYYCVVCEKQNETSYLSCKEKYKEYCEKGKR